MRLSTSRYPMQAALMYIGSFKDSPIETQVRPNQKASLRRSKICVRSLIGLAVILLYSNNPVIPDKCSANGKYDIQNNFSWIIRFKPVYLSQDQ